MADLVQHAQDRAPQPAERSAWSPFRHKVYRLLWIATVVANVGAWMYSAAAAWLMTSLNSDPVMVALVQVATSLPVFLFAMPAGALADIIPKRRFILALEIAVAAISAVFASLLSADLVGPATLLFFVFLVGTCSALEAPAWQSIVPQLVPREDLPAAVAANSVGINISRAIGPALAGILIASFSVTAPFWIDAFSNLGVIAVFLWWRPPRTHRSALPAERFGGAIRAGFRYALYNRPLRATLARTMGFFLFASAYWALLPLVARSQISGGPELYGVLLGAIGASAVGFAFVLPRLKARFGADGMVILGELGTAATLVLLGLAREPLVAIAACILAGGSWIAAIAESECFGAGRFARLGARPGPCHVRDRVLRKHDHRQRSLGRTCCEFGPSPCTFSCRRRRPCRHSADEALEIANRAYNGSYAVHGLAGTSPGDNSRYRFRSSSDYGRISRGCHKARTFSPGVSCARPRAQAGWGLRLGCVRRHSNCRTIYGDFLGRVVAGTSAPA